jgi:hypothetical protein
MRQFSILHPNSPKRQNLLPPVRKSQASPNTAFGIPACQNLPSPSLSSFGSPVDFPWPLGDLFENPPDFDVGHIQSEVMNQSIHDTVSLRY